MKITKLLATTVALLGALIASPSVFAHATYNVGATGAEPVWTNGSPSEWLAADATVPSIGYLGIHSLSNKRVIQTGFYVPANSISAAALGGAFGGANPTTGDSLQGQLYKFNEVSNTPGSFAGDLPPTSTVSVAANSWATGNGLSWGNIHVSSGTGNPEANLMPTVNFLNITVGDDTLYNGVGQLAFSLYQGWATGPGMQGLNLLGTALAGSIGEDIGLSIALSGLTMNGAGTEGQYTIVVGDQSNVGGKYRMALEASTVARYANNVVSAVSSLGGAPVPVPGAVWLFGSALAGFVGLRRKVAA